MTALALLRHQSQEAARLDAAKAALAGGHEATALAVIGSMGPRQIAAEL